MTAQQLFDEITALPENKYKQVVQFVDLIKSKSGASETMLISESAWAKDWLTPEEDEAWKDL